MSHAILTQACSGTCGSGNVSTGQRMRSPCCVSSKGTGFDSIRKRAQSRSWTQYQDNGYGLSAHRLLKQASQANIRIENKKKNNHVSGNMAGFFRPKAATTANMLTAWLRIGRGPRTKGKSTSQSLSSIQSTHHLQQAGPCDLRSVVAEAIKNCGPRKKHPQSERAIQLLQSSMVQDSSKA